MRKILVFSIVLVFAGVIITLASNLATEKYEGDYITVATVQFPTQLEVNGIFDQNDLLLLFFPRPNPKEGFFPDSTITVPVEIIDPNGHKAEFEAVFKLMGVPPQQHISLNQIKLVRNEASLIVDENSDLIGGVVSNSGEYKGRVNVSPQMVPYYWTGPLKELYFYKQLLKREYPYWGILPIGIFLIAAGTLLAIWGIKGSKRKVAKRKARLKIGRR